MVLVIIFVILFVLAVLLFLWRRSQQTAVKEQQDSLQEIFEMERSHVTGSGPASRGAAVPLVQNVLYSTTSAGGSETTPEPARLAWGADPWAKTDIPRAPNIMYESVDARHPNPTSYPQAEYSVLQRATGTASDQDLVSLPLTLHGRAGDEFVSLPLSLDDDMKV